MELQHHGIKGQKWGVRRFQNKDGTLTPAGKKRLEADNRREKMTKLATNENLSKREKEVAKYGSMSREDQWKRAAQDAVKKLARQEAMKMVTSAGTKYYKDTTLRNIGLDPDNMPRQAPQKSTQEQLKEMGADYVKQYATLTYSELRAKDSAVRRLDKKYNEDGITYKQIRKDEKKAKKAAKKNSR